MTHYRIPEMTESLVGKASNYFDSEMAETIFYRKDFARIFHTEWKLKSEKFLEKKLRAKYFAENFLSGYQALYLRFN